MKVLKQDKLNSIRPYYNVHGIYDISDIKSKSIGHFFDKGAMRFFNSRILSDVFPSTKCVYFVTSEQYDYKSPRLFTVRSFDLTTRSIETVGEFQEYATRAQAISAAINLAYEGLTN